MLGGVSKSWWNLPLALGVAKGRAQSVNLRRSLGRFCALSVATGPRLHVRWVASERNPCDAVSRGRHGWFSGRRDLVGPRPRRAARCA
eukprot:5977989-Pyramimonas_sp.AAC.1